MIWYCVHAYAYFIALYGDSLIHYHMVSLHFPQIFWDNWRLGLKSVNQKESIGIVSMPWASNLSLDNFF